MPRLRDETGLFDLLKRYLSETFLFPLGRSVDTDEPLFRRTEDKRFVASPTVWIGVGEFTDFEYGVSHHLYEAFLCFEDMLSDELFGIGNELFSYDRFVVEPRFAYGHEHRQIVFKTYSVIVFSVSRSGVYASRSVVHENVFPQHDS